MKMMDVSYQKKYQRKWRGFYLIGDAQELHGAFESTMSAVVVVDAFIDENHRFHKESVSVW